MKLFGRKKEDEYEDEEDGFSEEEESNDRKLTRKFKDLKPENRKKRKEPPKPWGKKERIIVGAFFIITTLAAAFMFLFSHEFKFPGLPKITLKNINFENPFAEKVIELGQKSNAPKDDPKATAAIKMFNDEVRPLGGVYGFLVIRLEDGSAYGVSSDKKFQGASMLKLPLMALMYRMSGEGNIDLDTKYSLKDSDKVKGSGIMYQAPKGTVYTYRQLAEYMGKHSDRTAYKVMKDVVTPEKLKQFLIETGLNNTDIETGFTTPTDMGIIFEAIWGEEMLGGEDKAELLNFLTDTDYEKWISAGVPDGVTVAHKFGTDEGVLADGGIVLSESPYILIIMAQGITKQNADSLFPEFSRNVYNLENNVQ
jgi:beta-lactamase class A